MSARPLERSGKVARGGGGEDMLVVKNLAVEFFILDYRKSRSSMLYRAHQRNTMPGYYRGVCRVPIQAEGAHRHASLVHEEGNMQEVDVGNTTGFSASP